jgi:hypothetical protein
MDAGLSFDELANMVGAARCIRNKYHIACPLCGPQCRKPINRRRRVMAILMHDDGSDGYTYICARCMAKGSAFPDKKNGKHHAPVKVEKKPEPDNSELARQLWSRAVSLRGTPAELYLRRRECVIDSPNIRFLKGEGRHHHAMIARFSSRDGSTSGIHMTRINADGGKADIEPVKIMLGPSAGWPIIVAGGDDSLCIAEGIEDTATMQMAIGGAAWAAGSAGRIAQCLRRAKSFSKIIMAVDDDLAGERALKAALEVRPDLIAVKFIDGLDANATLRLHGIDAVRNSIQVKEQQA